MGGAIIWYIILFGVASLFYFIGIYAQKLEKPMWFWSGIDVDASKISDIKAYNKENSRMWKQFSLWFWLAGLAKVWSSAIAVTLLVLANTAGLALLVHTFMKIEKKYQVR